MYRFRSRPGPTGDLDLGRQACLLLPEENANPECGQPTIFQISHHWGIARPNCPRYTRA
jgi:hypothetical protein